MNIPTLIDKEAVLALKEAITPIAEKIGQGAEHLYYVFVKQQVVLGVQDLVLGVVQLAIVALVARAVYKNRSQLRRGLEDLNWMSFASVAVVAVLLLFVLPFGVQHIVDSLPRLINPEYFAIQDILNHFKK